MLIVTKIYFQYKLVMFFANLTFLYIPSKSLLNVKTFFLSLLEVILDASLKYLFANSNHTLAIRAKLSLLEVSFKKCRFLHFIQGEFQNYDLSPELHYPVSVSLVYSF